VEKPAGRVEDLLRSAFVAEDEPPGPGPGSTDQWSIGVGLAASAWRQNPWTISSTGRSMQIKRTSGSAASASSA